MENHFGRPAPLARAWKLESGRLGLFTLPYEVVRAMRSMKTGIKRVMVLEQMVVTLVSQLACSLSYILPIVDKVQYLRVGTL